MAVIRRRQDGAYYTLDDIMAENVVEGDVDFGPTFYAKRCEENGTVTIDDWEELQILDGVARAWEWISGLEQPE